MIISDSQAESAALSHFNRVAYSQRRAIVQQVLVEFYVMFLTIRSEKIVKVQEFVVNMQLIIKVA